MRLRVRKTWPLLLALIVGLAAITWAATRLNPERDDAPGASAGDPGMSHVHGLGLDPTDGTLFAATHFGMFRVVDGEPERIGDSYQDTMGFTVSETGRFLGSGHPDAAGLDAGLPPLLGLIESADAGQSWTTLAMAGEADFHAIATSGTTVFAWDANTAQLYRSTNGTDLEARSVLALTSLAADPDDPGELVAATAGGVLQSSDGGATWGPANGPPLLSLSWDRTGGLWGATESGDVWQRTEDGWRPRGHVPGEVHVVLVTPEGSLYAAGLIDGDAAIWESPDQAATWRLAAGGPP